MRTPRYLQTEPSATGGHQEGNSAKAGHSFSSSQQDNSRQSSSSGSESSVDGGVMASSHFADRETGHAVRANVNVGQSWYVQDKSGCLAAFVLHHPDAALAHRQEAMVGTTSPRMTGYLGIPFVDRTNRTTLN